MRTAHHRSLLPPRHHAPRGVAPAAPPRAAHRRPRRCRSLPPPRVRAAGAGPAAPSRPTLRSWPPRTRTSRSSRSTLTKTAPQPRRCVHGSGGGGGGVQQAHQARLHGTVLLTSPCPSVLCPPASCAPSPPGGHQVRAHVQGLHARRRGGGPALRGRQRVAPGPDGGRAAGLAVRGRWGFRGAREVRGRCLIARVRGSACSTASSHGGGGTHDHDVTRTVTEHSPLIAGGTAVQQRLRGEVFQRIACNGPAAHHRRSGPLGGHTVREPAQDPASTRACRRQ